MLIQNLAEAELEGLDTKTFIRFLETEHESNSDIQRDKNIEYMSILRDTSLLQGRDKKQMRINIRAAVERYTHPYMSYGNE
jgi:hypothetical protein